MSIRLEGKNKRLRFAAPGARLTELGVVEAVRNGVVRGSEMPFLKKKGRTDEAHQAAVDALWLREREGPRSGCLREKVLERDGYRCRVCAELPETKRVGIGHPPIVHHRVPGVSKLHLMITLCAAHHAQSERLQLVTKRMSLLLLTLGREQHPEGHEQITLNFGIKQPAARKVALFEGSDRELIERPL